LFVDFPCYFFDTLSSFLISAYLTGVLTTSTFFASTDAALATTSFTGALFLAGDYAVLPAAVAFVDVFLSDSG